MNTKIYKQVHTLASDLMNAAQSGNDEKFDALYAQLEALCVENEDDKIKNHPVQWETLADFAQDSREALVIYEKALKYALAIDAADYIASINYAKTILFTEDMALDKDGEKALATIKQASEYASKIEDAELKNEIEELFTSLQH